MTKADITTLFPRLNSKSRGVNVAGTFSGMAGVDDFDTGFVVFIDGCGRIDGMTKLTEDRT